MNLFKFGVYSWIYAQEWDYWIISYSFLWNPHIVLHCGCISLHSHQQCRRVPYNNVDVMIMDLWKTKIRMESLGKLLTTKT